MAQHNSKLSDVLRTVERKILADALRMVGTQAKVAEMFGVDNSAVTKLVADYGLNDRPASLGTSWAVVSKSGYLLGMLDQDGRLDGVKVPELGEWLQSGRVRMVAGKSFTDFKQQGVSLSVVGV